MSRSELIERFSLERVQPSPATLDYQKLDWMNGVYIRALPPGEFAEAVVGYLREEGYGWDDELVRRVAPLVQEKIKRLGEVPELTRFFFEDVEPDPSLVDGNRPILQAAAERLREVEPFAAEPIEQALRDLAVELDLSPRKAFQPIRVAVTGSTVSPGLFESLELLGRERVLRRLSAAGSGTA